MIYTINHMNYTNDMYKNYMTHVNYMNYVNHTNYKIMNYVNYKSYMNYKTCMSYRSCMNYKTCMNYITYTKTTYMNSTRTTRLHKLHFELNVNYRKPAKTK